MVLEAALPPGHYRAEWFDTKNGRRISHQQWTHPGGVARLPAPAFTEDVVLALRKGGKQKLGKQKVEIGQ